MTTDDKRSKMTRRKPQPTEVSSAPEPAFEKAFTSTRSQSASSPQ